jgi:hypothetical protein
MVLCREPGKPRSETKEHGIDKDQELSLAKTLSGSRIVDLSTLTRTQSHPMITLLLRLIRLLPYILGGHRQLVLRQNSVRSQVVD